MRTIKMSGMPSTLAVMNWIRDNDCPQLKSDFFEFEEKVMGNDLLIVSSVEEKDIQSFLEEYPEDSWHEVFGMRRTTTYVKGMWYFYINGKFYYCTD